jgi:hypothetical protein
MRPDRRGFVLPTTLMVMTLLTVLLSAAFVLVSAEFRATDNTLASQRALAIAQAGLQNWLARSGTLVGGYDSVGTIAYPGGIATVAASRVLTDSASQTETWVVRAYGQVTDPQLTGTVTARRVVATLALRSPGLFRARAALVAANDVRVSGNTAANPISGTDICGVGLDTAGLTIATGDYNQTGPPGYPGPTNGIEYVASRAAAYDSSHVDWAALLAGDFTPDYDVSGGSWPALTAEWPVYYSSGDVVLTSGLGARHGVLVAQGNVRFASYSSFQGIVIAGGNIRNDSIGNIGAPFSMEGTVIAGLNNGVTPNSVQANRLYRFSPTGSYTGIRWASCHVRAAAAAMSILAPIRGTWTDSWTLY